MKNKNLLVFAYRKLSKPTDEIEWSEVKDILTEFVTNNK